MRKSKLSLILGLISSFVEFIFSWVMIFILSLTKGLAEGLSGDSNIEINILVAFAWVMMVGTIISIVGSALCKKNSRIGGFIILIGCAFCMVITIFLTMGALSSTPDKSSLLLFVFNLFPLLLMITSGFVGIFAKKRIYGDINEKIIFNADIPQNNIEQDHNNQ